MAGRIMPTGKAPAASTSKAATASATIRRRRQPLSPTTRLSEMTLNFPENVMNPSLAPAAAPVGEGNIERVFRATRGQADAFRYRPLWRPDSRYACPCPFQVAMNGPMLTVASYNIRKALGTDRRRSPERILEVLGEIDADIVALQEADRRFGLRSAVIPEWMLESHTPWRAVPLGVRAESMGWHGNAILIRRDHRLIDHDIVHLPSLEPRGAVTAVVGAGELRLRILGMHLDLSGLWRRRQSAAILHYLDQQVRHGVDATILMGDLNEWSRARGCLQDFASRYAAAPCGRSFHATRPVAALDRIFWGGALRLADSGVHASPAARRASDHLPIWARFDVMPAS
jgi:endonuclease/exonuclease/phosphatase family metal-dependent hydrolase